MVTRRVEELQDQARHQMADYGMPEDRIKQRLEEFKDKFRTEAEEQVKVFLILETVAKLENIKSGDRMLNSVIEFLFAEAEWS